MSLKESVCTDPTSNLESAVVCLQSDDMWSHDWRGKLWLAGQSAGVIPLRVDDRTWQLQSPNCNALRLGTSV